MKEIHCTVGILTYNSEEVLERCLQSLEGFSDIVIADGGSTDNTIAIARKHNARIISQSNPGHPITDFALERNILLRAANERWFFYVDSDEIVTQALREDIRQVVEDPSSQYGAYRVRYLKTNEDASKVYRTYKEYYQGRLCRTDVGATFVRKVHERLQLPPEVTVGQIEGPWYVLLDADDLSFSVFSEKAWKRTYMTAKSWQPKGPIDVLHRIILTPTTQVLKSLTKIVVVKIRWGKDAIPTKYELLRVLYAVFLFIQHTKRLIVGRAF